MALCKNSYQPNSKIQFCLSTCTKCLKVANNSPEGTQDTAKDDKSVFLRVKSGRSLPAGTLIGFVPGVYEYGTQKKYDESLNLVTRAFNFSFRVNCLFPYPNHRGQSILEMLENIDIYKYTSNWIFKCLVFPGIDWWRT